jgi:hypothetical protein
MKRVRQSIFSVFVLLLGYTCALAADSLQLERARAEYARLKGLAEIGAVSQARLEQAKDAVADAEDDDVLRRLLYGNVGVESLSESQAKEVVAAAERRVERVAKRFRDQSALVEQGVLPKNHAESLESELAERRLTLQLAENRARIFEELLAMAKAEEQFIVPAGEEAAADFVPVESYVGSGVFKETHLSYVADLFERQFKKALPISAKGQTALHTSLGFDHAGRVDVAVNPDDAEGVWLRETLERLRVPYIALRAAITGKSTGPHIHIGLPSNRLRQADGFSGSGLN